MRCGSCGFESESSRKFYGECGTAFPKRCVTCRALGAPDPADRIAREVAA